MSYAIFGYNREGSSFGLFMTDTLLFATPILGVESAAFALWSSWRRQFRSRPPSPLT